MADIRITAVAGNTVRQPKLLAEHGLSFLVEAGGAKILFDTGQGMALPHNARQMNLHLGKLNAVVRSRGHYGHTGGLGYVVGEAKKASICVHPAALHPRYDRWQQLSCMRSFRPRVPN